ncbi:MAG: sigma-70 family RNA polymerase sigma factor [Pseudomonadota bacterium]
MKNNTLATIFYYDIKRYVANRVDNINDTEDIVQSIFLKVVQSQGPNTLRKLRPWLFTIAHNTIIDYYRDKNKKTLLDINIINNVSTHNPLNTQNNFTDCLLLLMKKLPLMEKNILMWVDMQEQTLKDYARNNQLNYNSAKSTIHRARKHLQAALTNCCQLTFDRYHIPIGYKPKSRAGQTHLKTSWNSRG